MVAPLNGIPVEYTDLLEEGRVHVHGVRGGVINRIVVRSRATADRLVQAMRTREPSGLDILWIPPEACGALFSPFTVLKPLNYDSVNLRPIT